MSPRHALLLVAIALSAGCGREKGEERERETDVKPPAHISRTPQGDTIVTLDAETQRRAGLRAEVLQSGALAPDVVAYGRLEEDPAESFLLRAPIEGFLRAEPRGRWPRLGDRVADGTVIGAVEPRFAPAERLGLEKDLAAARSERSAGAVSAGAARAAYERARILNADNKNVSDRAVEEAEANWKEQEQKVKAAEDTIRLLEDALRSAGAAAARPLRVERGGEVVEVTANPGEAVESGSPLLRVARFERLLARVETPLGERVPAAARTARIVPAGFEDQPIRATRVALVAAADPATQGQSVLFRLDTSVQGLRPGIALTAYVELPGGPRRGVIVPRSALVRVGGRTFAYAQTGADQFVRKPVPLDHPVQSGYFIAAGLSPGDRVVVEGAQTLLSEEFKSQIAGER